VKRREFNEWQQARLTTRILTNSRIFRHARVLVIYKESLPGLLARLFLVRTAGPRKALPERGTYGQVIPDLLDALSNAVYTAGPQVLR